jgi:PAS domain S-box-containing protein
MPNTTRKRESKVKSKNASAREFLKVMARSEDGVFAVDADQRIVFWSAAAEKVMGLKERNAIGRHCYDVVVGTDYEGHTFCRDDCPTIRAARRGRGVENYDIDLSNGGKERWVNVSIVPMPRSLAGEAMAVHLVRDVTQRRRSERLAQATVDMVAEFMPGKDGVEGETEPHPAPDPALTPRELEVLGLLADGLGTQELAEKLGLSEATVRNHIQRLLAKLGVHSRLEAVVWGARHALV